MANCNLPKIPPPFFIIIKRANERHHRSLINFLTTGAISFIFSNEMMNITRDRLAVEELRGKEMNFGYF